MQWTRKISGEVWDSRCQLSIMADLLAQITPIADSLRSEALRIEQGCRDWEVLAEEEGVLGLVSPDHITVCSIGEVAVGITTVYAFINDSSQMFKWTHAVSSQELLISLDANTDIMHRIYTAQDPTIPPYDFVYFTRRTREVNSSLTEVGCSIAYSGAPKPAANTIRGELLNTSYILRKLTDSTTRITWIRSIDPKGQLDPEKVRILQTEDSLTVLRIRREILSEDYLLRSTQRSERTKEREEEAHRDEGEVLVEKLDEEFFRGLLAQVHMGKELRGGEKFEMYLSEKLLPVLLPGVEALSKETERFMLQKEKIDPRVRSRFNPVLWLAEYLMRNNPSHLPLQPEVTKNFEEQKYLMKARKYC